MTYFPSRRDLLLGSLLFPAAAAGQSRPPAVRYRNYARCLPDHLRDLAEAAYRKRSQALGALTDEAAIRERQQWVRRTFWELVGGEPERTPLNARVTRSVERPGFRIDCVVFESRPGVHVSANLYLPTTGKGPYPGVLFQPGHSSNGKSYALYQLCCQGLARLGFAVLTFDPMGQGERTAYPGDIPWQSRLPGGADDEHTLPGKQMLLVGDSATRLQTWDAVRALDYLAAHPMVDPARLASTGQSGGGTNTMLLACVDDRLAAAAPCCANSENIASADFLPPGPTDDAEQNFPGAGPLGFDRWDLLYPLAPKPLLVLASAKDFAGTYSPRYIENGTAEYERLAEIYTRLGRRDRLAWHDSPLPHGIGYDMRMEIYHWMRRWLQGQSEPLTEEPAVEALPDRELFVTPGGSVFTAFHGDTAAALARKATQARTEPRAALAALLRPQAPPANLRAETLGRAVYRRVKVEAIEVPSAPRIFLPAWLVEPPEGTRARCTMLLLDPAGRGGWQEGALLEQLATAGINVCAADIRGVGDLTPEYSGGAARHARSHATEQHYAWSSLILGDSLAAQRVTDILALAQALRNRYPGVPVRVAARGILTMPALYAAHFDDRLSRVLLHGGLVSFASVLAAGEYRGGGYFLPGDQAADDPFGGWIPGVLRRTDLPEMAAALGPRLERVAMRQATGEPAGPGARWGFELLEGWSRRA